MTTYEKGKQSRKEIISSARKIFNESGIQITLTNLSERLDTTLGRLTYHFSNKDLLFIAIAREYENKLVELRERRNSSLISLNSFISTSSRVMDLQYEYRCAMRYIVSSMKNNNEIRTHIQETYSYNRENIRNTIEALVQSGSLQSRILIDNIYEVFLFQLTNLFTTWVIHCELYDSEKSFTETKPIYMKGIISIFIPYVTAKGQQELDESGIFAN